MMFLVRKPGRFRRVVWLLRQLSQDRFIVRLFLIGLLLLVGIGFTGALQNQLYTIGGGHTGLVYNLISARHGARLTPLQESERFKLVSTADATLQRHFLLEGSSGVLTVRDGLRSLSFQSNPLGSFPIQIIQQGAAGRGRAQQPDQAISIYLHLLSCRDYLALQSPSRTPPPPLPTLSEAEAVRYCDGRPSLVRRASTLLAVEQWLASRADALGLLDTQKEQYLADARLILNQPPDGKWHPSSPQLAPWTTPVWQIFVLRDKALPGLEVFRVEGDTMDQSVSSLGLAGLQLESPAESGGGALLSVFRITDWFVLALLGLRYPVLILVGILLPVLALIIRQRDLVVRRCLEPYLLLLLGQLLTLIAAEALMGEGLMVWVGFIYTFLRILQLSGILMMANSSSPHLRRLFDLRRRRWLRNLLVLELGLWGLNGVGLTWHILSVLGKFDYISPA
jgi:hypothetical protein